jgi:DNA-binding NarL/FixJ family response regulator
LADRNRMIREVIARGLRHHQIEVVAGASSVPELEAAVSAHRPDVVILSDPLGGAAVDDAISELVGSGTHVVVLSEQPSEERILACLERGASGFLSHDLHPARIAEAVMAVGEGGAALYSRAASVVLAQWRGFRSRGQSNSFSLTPREAEVLAAMAEGLPAKAIAKKLGVALKTVESHKIRLFDKLGARTQAHAVSIAMGHGLIGPSPSHPNGAAAS